MMLNPTTTERVVSPLSVSATVAIEIAKNMAMSVPVITKLRTKMGRTSLPPEPGQLQRYVFDLLDSVMQFGGGVAGKSILEIGPGDNLVTGLAFLAAGAKSYTVVDRFPGAYGSDDARRWYRLLAENWPHGAWPASLDPDKFPDYPNISSKGLAVESASDALETYDIVCSFAVGEHVSDIDEFARLTHNALTPGGVAVHVIDFGGHQWNRFGDPFLFLKFPESVWQMMGSARGEPNRVRFDAFKACFERAGLSVDVPFRLSCDIDPRDAWVKARADASFLTTEATFVLRHAD
jgi:SAM-dependent methyltransferase